MQFKKEGELGAIKKCAREVSLQGKEKIVKFFF